MATKRFMIAPLNSGLQTDVKPWLISDESFAKLENAYLYYGRVRKRFGGRYMNGTVAAQYQQLYSRFGVNIGTTNGAGNLAATVVPGASGAIGQVFGVGTQALGHEIFTVISDAAGAQPMLATGAGNGTFDVGIDTVVINGSIANAPVYYYPALPVMGLPNFQQAAINDEQLFGFDTRLSYQFADLGNGRRWERLGTAVWSGTNADFFWSTSYRGALAEDFILFVTNNVEADGMRFWDGAIWTVFNPIYSNTAGDTILTCKVMASFKERLVLFNTLESQGGGAGIRFLNRIRFSQVGNPLEVNAFNTNTNPGGGFIDMPTTEAIISVRALKDRLIMFCEQSTWELVYTNNKADPFRVQRINSELGVESAQSTVVFDKAVLGIGNVGIHACNGTNVERIDEKIRQTIFEINNDNDGVERVYGIRDYPNELVYWSYPDQVNNPTFPTKVLVYNYRTGAWAKNDDSITAFGNFFLPQDLVWQDLNIQWQDAHFAWNDAALQGRFRSIVAGNQEGFTFITDTGRPRNAAVLSITNMNFAMANMPVLTVINHNLFANDFILIENVQGVNVGDFNNVIFQVVQRVDVNNIRISRLDIAGQAYNGGGVISRVSRIDILTKQFNFFQQDGRNAYISKVDFNVDKTANGQLTVDYYTSTSELSLVTAGTVTGALMGTSVLETTPYALVPMEQQQKQLWHPIYTQAEGEYVQIRIYLSDNQMFNFNIALSDFELNAMTFYAEPTATRLQ